MGLVAVLLVRPRDRWADAGTGLATGLVAGLVAFATGVGPAAVMATMIVPSISDFMLLGEATTLERFNYPNAPRRTHPTDDIVARYPDLARVKPSGRGVMLYPKIISDQISGAFLGIWYGLGFSFGIFALVGTVQTMTASFVLRRRKRLWSIFLQYVIVSLSILVVLYTLAASLWSGTWPNPIDPFLALVYTLYPPGAGQIHVVIVSLFILFVFWAPYIGIKLWRRWKR
jgi:hypothetical protein